MSNHYPVRVFGLSSEKGKKMNGLVGIAADPLPANLAVVAVVNEDERIQVWFYGHPEPTSIKRKNMDRLDVSESVNNCPTPCFVEVTPDLNKQKWNIYAASPIFAVNYDKRESPDLCPRFTGCIASIFKCLKSFPSSSREYAFALQVPDLNLCQALNWAVATDRVITSGGGVEWAQWQELIDFIKKEVTGQGMSFFACFKPATDTMRASPVWPTRHPGRLLAVEQSLFQIYPCPEKDRYGYMEVQFVYGGTLDTERWVDCGAAETRLYVRNAAHLGQEERLLPRVLSKVDSPAFWSAIFHFKVFLSAIETFCDESMLAAWTSVAEGVKLCSEHIGQTFFCTELSLLPKFNGEWKFANKKEYGQTSIRCARAALLEVSSQAFIHNQTNGHFSFLLPVSQPLRNDFMLYSKVWEEDNRKQAIKMQRRLGVGLPSDSNACCCCNKVPEALLLCSRCGHVSYCCAACQKYDFSAHKKVCVKLSTQVVY